jgi:DNA end-binding protein Ku
VVMHQRERLLAMEPRGKGLVAYTLRTHDEVKDPDEVFDDIPDSKPNKAMLDIAAKIIEQQEGPFEPETFKDHYEDALRGLIADKEKRAGATVTTPDEPDDIKVIDLMEALRRSLGAGGKGPAAKKTAAKLSAKKRA